MDEPYGKTDGVERSMATFLLGIGVGAALGAAMAMLFAPQSGIETRSDLTELSGRVKERADDMVSELKRNLDELSVKSHQLVETTRERVESAIQAGKKAADEKQSELQAQIHPDEPA